MINSGANALVMKEYNVHLVRRTLKEMREATKHQIAEAAGLSTVTVATVLQRLIDEQAVFEVGMAASTGGRPAQLYRFNANHAHVLVLFTHEQDGQDVLHVRVADLYGECVYTRDAPLDAIMLTTFEPFIDAALEAHATIRALGFGLPGIELDGKVVGGDYPALTGTDFSAHYQTRYQLPVIVENDVNAACVGYCTRHGIQSPAAALYLYFPQKYPPGGGIVIDGHLYKGWTHYAGEVSGMPLGIDWLDPALYRSPERVTAAIATLITAAGMLLNPQEVILYGAFLTDQHLATVDDLCHAQMPAHAVPRLYRAADFTQDYQDGMIAEALALLEPQIPITL